MKFLSKILFLIFLNVTLIAHDAVDYHGIIQPYSVSWQDDCIAQLSTQEVATIADMLLLSYQIVQASVIMTQARLIMQKELLDIVTLSINDTFDVSMQAQKNDLSTIKSAITTIEESQEKIKFACNALKYFGPLVINIDPIAIQSFIANLKNVILTWAKTQQDMVAELEILKEEFITTTNLFGDFKIIFDTIVEADPAEHNQLLQGANSLTNMYKKTENFIGYLTVIRQKSLADFDKLLTVYFKDHYQILYNRLQNVDTTAYKLIAMPDQKAPHPDQLFAFN
ncbi:MAG: hypothetical protein Q8Q60_00360 [Candidatus Chromulinivorax sp.]|nr:hypothetical protein [Candidatus Chromulinivorax sp.]